VCGIFYHRRRPAADPPPNAEALLEGWSTLKDAEDELCKRYVSRVGHTSYLHGENGRAIWPELDPATCRLEVWLRAGSVLWPPDATSQPDETWALGPRGGLVRTRHTQPASRPAGQPSP